MASRPGGAGPTRCSTRLSNCRARRSSRHNSNGPPAGARHLYTRADSMRSPLPARFVWVGVEPIGTRRAHGAVSRRSPARPLTPELQSFCSSVVGARHGVWIPARTPEIVLRPAPCRDRRGLPGRNRGGVVESCLERSLTNDTFHPLRALTPARTPRRRGRRHTRPVGAFRSRRLIPPSAEGRWSALCAARPSKAETTAWIAATAEPLAVTASHPRS